MLSTLATVLPVFLLIALGYLAVRTGYLAANWLAALGGVALRVLVPVLLFRSLAQNAISETLNIPYLAAYAAGSFAVLALGCVWMKVVRRQPTETAAISALGMSASNSAFIGYPVASQLLGPPAAVALSLCAIVENALIIPISLALADSASARHEPFRKALGRSLARLRSNPLIVSSLAGMVFSLLHWHLPQPVAKAVDLLAGASAPVALIYVGGLLVGLPLASMLRDVVEIGCGKLVLHPLLIALAVLAVGVEDPTLRMAAVIFAASPMMTSYPILGSAHGREKHCAAALCGATLAYFLTIGLVLAGLHALWFAER